MVQLPSRKEEGEAMAQTMAEYLLEQGEKRGATRAKREVILKIINLKFVPIPEPVIKKISSANLFLIQNQKHAVVTNCNYLTGFLPQPTHSICCFSNLSAKLSDL